MMYVGPIFVSAVTSCSARMRAFICSASGPRSQSKSRARPKPEAGSALCTTRLSTLNGREAAYAAAVSGSYRPLGYGVCSSGFEPRQSSVRELASPRATPAGPTQSRSATAASSVANGGGCVCSSSASTRSSCSLSTVCRASSSGCRSAASGTMGSANAGSNLKAGSRLKSFTEDEALRRSS